MVTTLLIAMVAMMLTAISYGRMASLYPSAGSAYSYVSKGINVYWGFLAGWAMFIDYLIVPIVNTIYGSLTLQRLIPSVPFLVWVIVFVFCITFLNLQGIKTTARSNKLLLLIMTVVIGLFIALSLKYLFGRQGWSGVFSYKPFYNAETFDLKYVITATSFAALTYIGFDGVTTLAEEVKNPRRNMLLAPVIVCLFTGIFSIIQIYLAQRVSPDYNAFLNIETAFYDVSEVIGGRFLFNAVAVILFIACLGSGLAGQAGAARLLYGMGRDGILPQKIFAHIDAKSLTPAYNLLIIGLLTIVGSICLNYKLAAELLNFGAFLAFMGVNLASLRQFYFLMPSGKRKIFRDLIQPVFGFLICFLIWINLPSLAKITGGIWYIIGLAYLIIKTNLFRKKPVMFDFNES